MGDIESEQVFHFLWPKIIAASLLFIDKGIALLD